MHCFVIAAAVLGSALAACERRPTSPEFTRNIDAFQPHITAGMSPAGLRIYIYRLEGAKQLWLGFPGEAPIVYARLKTDDGTVTDLPLRRP